MIKIMKEYEETHQQGRLSVENLEIILDQIAQHKFDKACPTLDFGVQISSDGRVWVCINGIAFLRFKPKRP